MAQNYTICKETECTGCMACSFICPTHAIYEKTDAVGRKIAAINLDKCIDCGACRQNCPNNRTQLFKKVNKCYAAWSCNSTDQIKCSSGGVATVFSRQMIRSGGVVAATVFDSVQMAKQRVIKDEREIDLLCGSKYVQSDTANVYQSIVTQLKNGKNQVDFGKMKEFRQVSSR